MTSALSRDVANRADLRVFASEFVAQLELQRFPRSVILLQGDVGAGKTTLTSELVAALGGHSAASSPSYAIANSYALAPQAALNLSEVLHVDLYRVESEDDLQSTGFWDLLNHRAQALVIIEWPEILDSLPDFQWRQYVDLNDGRVWRLKLNHGKRDESRVISIALVE